MYRVCLALAFPIFLSAFITDYNLNFTNNSPFKSLLRRDYTAFTCWLSCEERAAIMCFYIGYKDTGSAARPTSFTIDKAVDRNCQQFTTNPYSNGYDRQANISCFFFKVFFLIELITNVSRGHMVSANHMDQSDITIKESMLITNIMPQTATLNEQGYLAVENIFECYRDIIDLNSIVGIIMGDDTSNDGFVISHGVRTPDFYWRIIEKKDGDVIAWIFVRLEQFWSLLVKNI